MTEPGDSQAEPGQAARRESGLLQRLRRSLGRLEPRPRRVLAGFSGGADSLALILLLRDLERLGEINLGAVHVNHGVRQESAMDAALVREVAAAIGVPIDIRMVSAEQLTAHVGVGREEAMRRERYRQFSLALRETGSDLLALAHHQRDQAETVLLHLLRGAGLHGVSGMRSRSEMSVPWWDEGKVGPAMTLGVWRPLLAEPVAELVGFVEGSGLPVAHDASNADESYRRNAIRHSALPLLESIVPGATANLARFANLAAIDSDELDSQARRALSAIRVETGLDRDSLVGLPVAIQRRVIRIWIVRDALDGLEIPLHRIEEVLRVANEKGRPRIVEIGMGVSVSIDSDTVSVEIRDVQGPSGR